MKALMDWELYEEMLTHIEDKELRQKCFKEVAKLFRQDCDWISGEMRDASERYNETHGKYLKILSDYFKDEED